MFDKLAEKAREMLYLDTGLILEGNREMIVENCRRIEEYNEVFMQLISGSLCVQIWGSGLRAYDYRTGGLIIRGKISRIELSERSGRDYEGSAARMHQDKS